MDAAGRTDLDRAVAMARELLALGDATRAERLAELERADAALAASVRSLVDRPTDATVAGVRPGGAACVPQMPAPRAAGVRMIGTYAILGVLGEGGMGVVYLAEQAHPKRTVALKVIRSGSVTERQLRRFELESQVLARLQHPGIAQVYEAATADTGHGQQPFFAMEYVRGEPLTAHARRRGLSVRQRVELFIKVCAAVQHAHQKGVIHRDLKPGNILVDDAGEPKVLDFGVARATDADVQAATIGTEVGAIVGTVPYMSPEQISGDPSAIDTRSDVYTLGVILFELLTGRRPHNVDGKTVPEAVRVITEEEPVKLGSIDRTLRGDVQTIVAKAVEKDRARRYQSASDLAADLRRFLSDEPILARPASTAYRVRKFVRRNTALVGGVAVAAALLLAGGAATAWQAVEATRGRTLAEARGAEAQRQRDRAEAEARSAAAVNRFLQSVLSSANPELERSRELTVREAVDRAAATLPGEDRAAGGMAQDLTPEVELRVRETLVRTYRALGHSELAEPHAERNVRLAERAFGREHHAMYAAKNMLSLIRQDQGRLAEAEALAREAVEGLQAHGVPGDPDVLKAVGQLGQVALVNGKFDEARSLLVRAIDGLRDHPKADARDRIVAMENLAALHERLGEFTQAEAMLRESVAAREREFGADSVMAAYSLNNLGNALQRQGKLEEALEVSRRALVIRRAALEPGHPSVLNSANNVAVILISMNRPEEARPLMEEVVEGQARTLGPAHPTTLAALNNMGYLYQDLGRPGEAEATFRRALDARREAGLLGDPDAWMLMNNLAMLLGEGGRGAEAAGLYREALERSAGKLPEGHYVRAIIRNNLGACLTGLREFEAAERELRESHAVLEAFFKPGHERVERSSRRLKALYEAWGKPEKAAAR